jgi:hypothetical protein
MDEVKKYKFSELRMYPYAFDLGAEFVEVRHYDQLQAQLDRAIHCVSLLEIKGCPFDWTTCPELDRGLAQDCRRCWNNYIMEG